MALVVLASIPVLFLIPITLWSISFGFAAGYAGLLLLIFGSVMGWRNRSAKTLLSVPLGWLILNGALAANTVSTYDEKRNRYFEKVGRNEDLTFSEKLNVYGLNVAMAAAAFPFYQEASLESMYLLLPSRNGTRRFQDDFFLESERIRGILFVGRFEGNRRVGWSISDYEFGSREARFALALNPCELSWNRPDSTIRAEVRVEYPMSSEVTLIRFPFEIKVEEGLFGYLQKVGWLHPYDAVWIAKD